MQYIQGLKCMLYVRLNFFKVSKMYRISDILLIAFSTYSKDKKMVKGSSYVRKSDVSHQKIE